MPNSRAKKHIFGPVPSRRLGRSLGVDLVPFKTCTFDCIYCQLGPTTCKTITRREWVPTDDVIIQTREAIEASSPDYVTISGSGEPTLHINIGKIIDEIKTFTDIPIAVLTNGSLLYIEEVRDAMKNADLVIPSLDAGTDECFRKVNRPHDDLSFDEIVDGLISFRDHYQGKIWLEIFLLAGLTATDTEVLKMTKIADRIKPDRVQLNTVSRPACETYAIAVPEDQMIRYAARFGRVAEVIADFRSTHDLDEFAVKRDDVLALVSHRPCTLDDIADGLGLHQNEAVKYVEELINRSEIAKIEQSEKVFYISVTYQNKGS